MVRCQAARSMSTTFVSLATSSGWMLAATLNSPSIRPYSFTARSIWLLT